MLRKFTTSACMGRQANTITALATTMSSSSHPSCSTSSAVVTPMRHYAAANQDFYKVLGVDRGASEKDIKSAYRKRALATHPDQGGDKDEFAVVTEAYQVLSNAEKRRMYDQVGHDAFKSGAAGGMGGGGGGGAGPGGAGMSMDDLRDIFGGGGGSPFGDFFGGGGRSQPRQQQRVKDIDVRLSVTLEEVATGCVKPIRITRPQTCASCRGEGGNRPGAKVTCTDCNGSGQEVVQHRMGPGMVQQVVSTCRRCNGNGKTMKQEDMCKACHGVGFVERADTIQAKVPQGVQHGSVVVLEGQGGEIPGALPADLNLHVEMVPHRVFRRRGNDLIMDANVSLSDALLGIEIPVTLLDGRKVVIRSTANEVLKHNGVIAITGEGLKMAGTYGDAREGSLYIYIKVQMPKRLSPEQRQGAEKLFGAPTRQKKVPEGAVINGKVLADTSERLEQLKESEWSRVESGQAQSGRRSRKAQGRGGGGPEQVECAQQ